LQHGAGTVSQPALERTTFTLATTGPS